jgi:NDP-sugar pyrophosphorylase family protein
MDAGAMAIALVVDGQGCLLGTVTDGDVRRGMLRGLRLEEPVSEVMHRAPVTAPHGSPKDELLLLMRQRQIEHLPITDAQGRVVGLELLSALLGRPVKRENMVVIFAGGRGSRLRPLTDGTPKPLLDVGGRPLLSLMIDQMAAYGFRKFLIAIRHHADLLERQLGTGEQAGVLIDYLREPEPLGTAGALRLAKEQLTSPFLVVNGDLLTKVNFEHLLEFHESQQFDMTIAVKAHEVRIPYGVVQLANGEVHDLEEKPIRSFFVNAGIYVLNPSVLAVMPTEGRYDMTDLIQDALQQKRRVGGFPLHEYWLDIGRRADYEAAQEVASRWALR